jgi:FixJ family two-component response regulator
MLRSSTQEGHPTVFVVDDDALARSAVGGLARTMNLPCEQYTGGREFLDALDPGRAGCAVLEMHLPDTSGLEIQKELVSRGAALPVIFATRHATVALAVRAMRNGATHVLQKPFREHELWDAVGEAIEVDRQRRDWLTRKRRLQQCTQELTSDERQLMNLLAEGRSSRAIASQTGVCPRTVELRRSRIMRKLHVSTVPELVSLALAANGNGFSACREDYCGCGGNGDAHSAFRSSLWFWRLNGCH